MKRLLLIAALLSPGSAQAGDGYAVARILGVISDIAHHSHSRRENLGGPVPTGNLGPEVLHWLAKHGDRDALIVGRRNEDCPPTPDFVAGVGVVIKRSEKPISGVVCVTERGPHLELDR